MYDAFLEFVALTAKEGNVVGKTSNGADKLGYGVSMGAATVLMAAGLELLEQEKKQANATLRQQMDKLSNTAAALDWFWQIDEAYVRGRTSLCRSLIQNLESAGLESYLPTESITNTDRFSPYHRYLEIKEALG